MEGQGYFLADPTGIDNIIVTNKIDKIIITKLKKKTHKVTNSKLVNGCNWFKQHLKIS